MGQRQSIGLRANQSSPIHSLDNDHLSPEKFTSLLPSFAVSSVLFVHIILSFLPEARNSAKKSFLGQAKQDLRESFGIDYFFVP